MTIRVHMCGNHHIAQLDVSRSVLLSLPLDFSTFTPHVVCSSSSSSPSYLTVIINQHQFFFIPDSFLPAELMQN